MEHRIRGYVRLSDSQNGFRKNRRCCDYAAILHDVIREAKNKRLGLYIAVFDFRKAFDNVSIPVLVRRLKEIGVPGYLINTV